MRQPLFYAWMLSGTLLLACGCGSGVTTVFTNQFTASDGRPVFLEDIQAIITNTELDEQARRAALRALGIEDEKLIDALLTL